MIEDKVYPIIKNPQVDKCFAIHLSNANEYPYLSSNYGPATSNTDRFKITI